MARLQILTHSTVYRNPRPNLISEYVAFPAIQALPDDSLLCMCRHGTARESSDGVVKVHRSTDGANTWQPAGVLPMPPDIGEGYGLPGGFGITAQGETLAWVRYPSSTKGKSGQWVSRSGDGGGTWSSLERVETGPYGHMGVGGNLVTMADGTIVSASEWSSAPSADGKREWDCLITRSRDGGGTWESWRRIQGTKGENYFFDPRIAGLPDGRLLAVYWTHDMERDRGVNVHTAWSSDGGDTWTQPRDAGFWGQVTDMASLKSGRVVAVTNHRREPLGVRALLSEDGGGNFVEDEHVEIWGIEPARVRNAPVLSKRRDVVEDVLDSYHFFTFGTPSITQLSDGTVVAAFYVTEEHVTYVRCCCMKEVD